MQQARQLTGCQHGAFVAVADRQRDMRAVEIVERKIETLPTSVNEGERPAVRHEHIADAVIAGL